MNCKQAKQEMALCAGRDLDERAEQQLRRHLSSCPDCRDQWQRIQASTQLLQRAAETDPPVGEVRLWSDVSTALDQLERERSHAPAGRTPLWIPVFAVAALVMAALSMLHTLAPAPEQTVETDDGLRIAPSIEDDRPRFGIEPPNTVDFKLDGERRSDEP